MRGLPFALLLALAGCNPGIAPTANSGNETAAADNQIGAPQVPANAVSAPEANAAETAPASPPEATPGLAGMSPYRRREFERGWRDCMSGNFDGKRQGESYRIGCMAAEEAKQRRSDR